MAKNDSTGRDKVMAHVFGPERVRGHKVALAADPNDPDDFDVSEAGAELALEERRRRVGRPAGSTKEQVSLRIDKETLAKFRASGSGWQTRINDALREAAASIRADA